LSKVKVLVVPTNEELMIAMDTHNVVSEIQKERVFLDVNNFDLAGYK